MKKKKFVITFDDELTPDILNAFGKSIDKEGFIVETATGIKVPAKDGGEIRVSEFGGIIKGSEVYLKSDIASLINYVESRE